MRSVSLLTAARPLHVVYEGAFKENMLGHILKVAAIETRFKIRTTESHGQRGEAYLEAEPVRQGFEFEYDLIRHVSGSEDPSEFALECALDFPAVIQRPGLMKHYGAVAYKVAQPNAVDCYVVMRPYKYHEGSARSPLTGHRKLSPGGAPRMRRLTAFPKGHRAQNHMISPGPPMR